ncbi:MAG: multiple sugar transport system permease protein [Epulopiscium sp.]|jgi:multiple sugar transport system permease protein|uniref:ABC transporter permease subunit n=1 Tax=Defluviitalea raffinosedens TaxID=1450156 RepID=A0A7C8HHJ1_9FIRM|nr:sugar ABC transporter permease [Defluviitalea raffinosedens]KAE9634391.1 ABC transporter permease subunit [Defluviitalea raffinosedens]MBM7684822.1 multiple sugar transport system permease protein [Defluviitalea raffinosedens]MBZ4668139.1 ABC-type transporter, integral rane subunit [Defluviitaleaceae bacterium]MDK2787484.1 multiple sugar transport system permease protein [Candidatus Epulonipiscium sp.]
MRLELRQPKINGPKKAVKDEKTRLLHRIKSNKLAYLMITPAVIGMIIIHLIPIVSGLCMSFLKLNQFTLRQFLKAPFIGLDNYRTVLFDPQSTIRSGFLNALRNTAIFGTACSVSVIVIALLLAILLNREFKFRGLARTLLMTPWVVPSFVVGMLWGFMWQNDGIINRVLVDILHILPTKPFWLTGPIVLVAIIIPTIWRQVPFVMLMLLAGLQQIPDEYYEAAEIDGANAWGRFRHVTLPLLRPVLSIQILNGILNYVYSFNIVAMMFGHGAGFPGEYGDLLMTNINRNSFQIWQFGTGAAATVIVMICVMILVALWYKVFQDDLVVND